jgi:hypothetical protein
MITYAISIRQPYVELILQGKKKSEYRSRPTNIRERVYIYAALKPSRGATERERKGASENPVLPIGYIVGSVEIANCKWNLNRDLFAYRLVRPRRLRKHLCPSNQPQPCFWKPVFKKIGKGSSRTAGYAARKD